MSECARLKRWPAAIAIAGAILVQDLMNENSAGKRSFQLSHQPNKRGKHMEYLIVFSVVVMPGYACIIARRLRNA
jgi:hypothetical protein